MSLKTYLAMHGKFLISCPRFKVVFGQWHMSRIHMVGSPRTDFERGSIPSSIRYYNHSRKWQYGFQGQGEKHLTANEAQIHSKIK